MNKVRRFWPYLLMVALVAASVLIWWHRDYLRDTWSLRGYEPPEEIVSLATDTAMTPYAERLFFVNQPELNDKEAFNNNCSELQEEVAVLGCFRGDRNGIYIYNITDPRLMGVEQVTAAHEMLHQAYDRLSTRERRRIDALLKDFYLSKLADESVKNKIALYEKNGTENLTTELHSIFGTEIAELPAELEEYYARYFSDRQKVVTFRAQSQAAFDDYRQKIADYDARLAELKPRIESGEAELVRRQQELRERRASLDSLLANDQVGSYNAAVPGYNELVFEYNTLLTNTKALIEQYNSVVVERNEVAVQARELSEALDSRLDSH